MQDHFSRQDASVRLVRFLRLLQYIREAQPSGVLNIRRLSQSLGYKEATIHRDLLLLQHALLIEHPKKGVYRLTTDALPLSQVSVALDELLALAFANSLVPEEMRPLHSLLKGLLERILKAARPEVRNLFEGAVAGMKPRPAGRDYGNAPWLALLEGCSRKLTIEMDYESTRSGRSVRRIDPYQLTTEGNIWMVHAWCHRRQEILSFALDKIRSAHATGEVFQRREKDWQAFHTTEGVFLGLRGGEPVRVQVRFHPEVAEYALKPSRWPIGLCAVLQPDGTVMLTGMAQGTEGILTELLRWRRYVAVEGGSELRTAMKEEVTLLHHLYSDEVPPQTTEP